MHALFPKANKGLGNLIGNGRGHEHGEERSRSTLRPTRAHGLSGRCVRSRARG
jgi:hypothetical protein